MAEEYPYMVSNNKIEPIFKKIQSAAIPPKFTNEVLKNLGFSSSNDRAIIPLLKRLNFLSDDGVPTEYYADLKDPKISKQRIGQQIKELYNELFAIDTNIQNASDDEIKGAIGRVTGKEEKYVNRYFATFKSLCDSAKFEGSVLKKEDRADKTERPDTRGKGETGEPLARKATEFHYNIQIHLPATTEIAVYNAIFKSLRDNLPNLS